MTRATLSQHAHGLGAVTLACLTTVSVLYSAIINGNRSVTLIRSAPMILLWIATPLVLGTGIIWTEVTSGRVLIFHGHGIPRSAYLLGRVFGTTIACMSIQLLVLVLLFIATLAVGGNLGLFFVLKFIFSGFVYFGYITILLGFLSTLFRGINNSAITIAAMFVYLLVLEPHPDWFGSHGKSIANILQLVFVGPIRDFTHCDQMQNQQMFELVVCILLGGLFLGMALLRYSHAELARWTRRSG